MSAEPLQTLSSLPEEQQMNENMVTLAHSPVEIIQIGEGKVEKEAQEEDEKKEKVREKGRGHREVIQLTGFAVPTFNFYHVPSYSLFFLREIFTTYFFSYPKVN